MDVVYIRPINIDMVDIDVDMYHSSGVVFIIRTKLSIRHVYFDLEFFFVIYKTQLKICNRCKTSKFFYLIRELGRLKC